MGGVDAARKDGFCGRKPAVSGGLLEQQVELVFFFHWERHPNVLGKDNGLFKRCSFWSGYQLTKDTVCKGLLVEQAGWAGRTCSCVVVCPLQSTLCHAQRRWGTDTPNPEVKHVAQFVRCHLRHWNSLSCRQEHGRRRSYDAGVVHAG